MVNNKLTHLKRQPASESYIYKHPLGALYPWEWTNQNASPICNVWDTITLDIIEIWLQVIYRIAGLYGKRRWNCRCISEVFMYSWIGLSGISILGDQIERGCLLTFSAGAFYREEQEPVVSADMLFIPVLCIRSFVHHIWPQKLKTSKETNSTM